LATSLASPVSSAAVERDEHRRERGRAAWLVTALTLLAVVVHGYHPYAEDGGVYLPEIKRLLRPELYPKGAEFVVGHLRFSIFAPVMAGLVRWSHLQVETVLLLVHLASFWMTLFAAWVLAARCYRSREAQWGAVALLAVWITLPVAGTSLMLMDPYVTARSFSTPLALLALVGALEFLLPRDRIGLAAAGAEWSAMRGRGLALCLGALAGAVAMHPLMGVYALGCVMLLGCGMSPSRQVRMWGTLGLCCAAVAAAGAAQISAVPESRAYVGVVLSRYYWFLGEWHWFELMGLVAPLAILALVAAGRGFGRAEDDTARVGLTRMAVVSGVTAVTVALRASPVSSEVSPKTSPGASRPTLRDVLPAARVLAGMVPYNVVRKADATFHRGTTGALVIPAVTDVPPPPGPHDTCYDIPPRYKAAPSNKAAGG